VIAFKGGYTHSAIRREIILSGKGDLHEAAQQLFSALHEAEQSGAELILAERVPETGIGIAINDRLERASA
jgi:L-threonylcarbamoyladenylate synthase